jgi:DNA-binding CsgD family transcriptional regulator
VADLRASTELLERDEACATLDAELEHALLGVGRTVVVAGEAGVGKTSLVRSFATRHESDVRVVWGACDALFTPRPLGPVYDIVQELGRGSIEPPAEADDNRTRFFGELLAELRAHPTVAVFEDVHWADEATLDALKYLGRRIASAPLLLVLTFRDDEVGANHPLRTVLGDLPGGNTARLSLAPLSPDGVAELARRGERSAHGLYEVTGGNPFFVTEVLAAGGGDIPETIVDAVLARAARLSDGGRRLLEAAAIVPGSVEIWLLDDLAGEDFRQLAECLASGMLTATGAGVGFRHELARIAIERALTLDRRMSLNEAALQALAAQPPERQDLSVLAHHAEAAGDADAVLRLAPAAAERASRLGAHREAAAQYTRALWFADRLPPETQARLYESLSYESFLTGEFEDAIAASTHALQRHRELGDLLKEGDCLRALSRLLWSSGRTPEAYDIGRQAVELLESLRPGPELARAYAQLAALSTLTDDPDGVAMWGTKAIDIAQRLGNDEILAGTRVIVSADEFSRGAAGGCASLERELELALDGDLEEVAARAFNHLVRIAMRWRDYSVVDRYLDAGFEYCYERELGNYRQGLGAERARLLLDRGDWAMATHAAGSVLSTARSAGMAPFIALTVLGQVRARRGDPDIWPPLDRALEMAAPSGELQRLGLVAAARAEAASLAGDPSQALEESHAAYDLAVRKRHPWLAGELAYWQWKSGALTAAPEWLAEPWALQIAGNWEAAAEAWQALGCPYEAAQALAEGDESGLRTAYEEFAELGAGPAAKQVARSLREHGASVPRGPRPSTRKNPAGLTARELEVVRLVAEGLQNTEIADRLVVSRRTVDHHVSAILRKLGARTRLEAAATAGRMGLTQDR